jgi:hypothetical protein
MTESRALTFPIFRAPSPETLMGIPLVPTARRLARPHATLQSSIYSQVFSREAAQLSTFSLTFLSRARVSFFPHFQRGPGLLRPFFFPIYLPLVDNY